MNIYCKKFFSKIHFNINKQGNGKKGHLYLIFDVYLNEMVVWLYFKLSNECCSNNRENK